MSQFKVCVAAFGVTLLIAACGGGGDGDSTSGGGSAPPPGTNPSTTPGTTPSTSSTVFTPASDDLATDIGSDYPNQTVAIALDINYQTTAIPSSGPYMAYSNGHCTDVTPDPQTYPNNLTTLVTLNRTKPATKFDYDDDCLPEINVSVASVVSEFVGSDANMRVRGSSTRSSAQKSFRIRSKRDSSTNIRTAMWYGEDTLQLNKHPYDLTRMRNKLAFDLMKDIPHHQSMRTQFFELKYTDSINIPADAGPTGSLGLYTHIERFSDDYVTRRGWKLAGANVFKAASFNFNKKTAYACNPDGTMNADLEAALELEVGDGKTCASLLQMMDDLSNTGKAFDTTFNQYFNRNNYLTWLATVILLGNYDTTTQNFALYQHPDTGKFYFLPWDYDAALDFSRQVNASSYADWAYGVGNWWDSSLHRRFMSEPGNLKLLRDAVEEIREKHLTQDAIRKLINTYKPTVRPFVTRSPDKDRLPGSSDEAQWEAEVDRLVGTIDKNYNAFLESLKAPMPFWTNLVTAHDNSITEIRWTWPTAFHPQGNPITYRIEFLPFDAADTSLPASQTAFDALGARTVTTHNLGNATSFPGTSLPSGAHWIRIFAQDATNNTSTHAFDSSYDNNSRFGVVCRVLPDNTKCPGVS